MATSELREYEQQLQAVDAAIAKDPGNEEWCAAAWHLTFSLPGTRSVAESVHTLCVLNLAGCGCALTCSRSYS